MLKERHRFKSDNVISRRPPPLFVAGVQSPSLRRVGGHLTSFEAATALKELVRAGLTLYMKLEPGGEGAGESTDSRAPRKKLRFTD